MHQERENKKREVPVSTIPAVVDKIVVLPYLIDWSIPQNWLAGDVLVIGLYAYIFWDAVLQLSSLLQNTYMKVIAVVEPVAEERNLVLSTPPILQNVQSVDRRQIHNGISSESYPNLFRRSMKLLCSKAGKIFQLNY